MKVKQHKNYRLYLASGLFLLITALKLLLPAQTAALRAQLRELVSRDADYVEVFESLGERLGGVLLRGEGEGPAPSPTAAPAAEAFRPVTLMELRERSRALLPEGVRAVQPGEATPAVVAAFLETQAAYDGYELPASVSYDMPELPFAYASPVAGYTSSGFGFREHPLAGEVRFHYGTDFAAWTGTPILAFADGTVALYGWDAGYGNYLIVDHGDGWTTLYAHCSIVYVTGGESVACGETIAQVGATGDVTGPHLHFELRRDGLYYNPEFWLA